MPVAVCDRSPATSPFHSSSLPGMAPSPGPGLSLRPAPLAPAANPPPPAGNHRAFVTGTVQGRRAGGSAPPGSGLCPLRRARSHPQPGPARPRSPSSAAAAPGRLPPGRRCQESLGPGGCAFPQPGGRRRDSPSPHGHPSGTGALRVARPRHLPPASALGPAPEPRGGEGGRAPPRLPCHQLSYLLPWSCRNRESRVGWQHPGSRAGASRRG